MKKVISVVLSVVMMLCIVSSTVDAAQEKMNLITSETQISPKSKRASYENGVLKMSYAENSPYNINLDIAGLSENFDFTGKITVKHIKAEGDDSDISIWNGLRIICGQKSQTLYNTVSMYRRVGFQIVNNSTIGLGAIQPYTGDLEFTDGTVFDFGIYRRGEYIVFKLNGELILDYQLTDDENYFTAAKNSNIGFIAINTEYEVSEMELYNNSEEISLEKTKYLNRGDNIPVLTFPGITQEQFADSFEVLEEALVRPGTKNTVYGFKYPFCGPGGAYGPCWWQLDTSLATSSMKWVDLKMAENVLRNFMLVQKENGRIALHGPDTLLDENNKCSSLPKLFITAYDILCMTEDEQLISDTYDMLKKYLDWWYSARYDEKTGLIRGIVEEWLPGAHLYSYPVETNTEVAEGCLVVGKLAGYLGRTEDAALCRSRYDALVKSINEKMYNESAGCFMGLKEDGVTFTGTYMVTAFNPFENSIADESKHEEMLKALTDDSLFNWSTNPLTSAAKTDPLYNETNGVYAAIQWYGCIWSLRSYDVIKGLKDIGRYDLSAYLSLRTAQLFNGNYAEFLNPTDASGNGVIRYSWSASQYAQIIIEEIFGIRIDRFENTISIIPNIDPALYGETLKIENLALPNGNTLSVTVIPTAEKISVSYEIKGDAENKYTIIVGVPEGETKFLLSETKTREEKGYSTVISENKSTAQSASVVFSTKAEVTSSSETDTDVADTETGLPDTETEQIKLPGKASKLPIIISICLVIAAGIVLTTIFIKKKKM